MQEFLKIIYNKQIAAVDTPQNNMCTTWEIIDKNNNINIPDVLVDLGTLFDISQIFDVPRILTIFPEKKNSGDTCYVKNSCYPNPRSSFTNNKAFLKHRYRNIRYSNPN